MTAPLLVLLYFLAPFLIAFIAIGRVNRKLNRETDARPDYDWIRKLEKEIYGEVYTKLPIDQTTDQGCKEYRDYVYQMPGADSPVMRAVHSRKLRYHVDKHDNVYSYGWLPPTGQLNDTYGITDPNYD